MKLFFGLVFILVGISLLFGFFNAGIWSNALDNFIAVWPVVFIFIGLGILSNIRALRWTKAVNGVLIILFVLFLFFWRWDIGWNGPLNTYTVPSMAIEEDVDEMTLIFRVASLEVELYPQTASEKTIKGNYQSYAENLLIKRSKNEITMEFPREYALTFSKNYKKKMTLFLPAECSYVVQIESGSTRWYSEFERNPFKSVEVNAGLATVETKFLQTDIPFDLMIRAAVATLDMSFPSTISYHSEMKGAFKSLSHQGTSVEDENNARVRISVESAVIRSRIGEKGRE
jgi:hypothetical protein